MRLIPKNWRKFQHYKDRNPPWIKLERRLLDDRDFMRLPVASRALAPCLWLLASESHDGSFKADLDELSFRLRLPAHEISEGLKGLIDNGFFLDASTMLAPCLQVAVPEREGETETESETEKEKQEKEKPVKPAAKKRAKPDYSDEGFNRFWQAYGYDQGRYKARQAWLSIKPDAELTETIIAAAEVYSKANPSRTYYKHATTWLNGRHWEDDPKTLLPKIAGGQPANRPPAYSAGLAIFGNLEEKRNERIIDITPPARLLGAEDL